MIYEKLPLPSTSATTSTISRSTPIRLAGQLEDLKIN
jgi:hypothetical protein